jgi:ABC-type polysaccharide/polyol phosphate export permease
VTPIIYPHEFLEKLGSPMLRMVLSLNPAMPIVRWFQMVVYEGHAPDPRTAALATLSALTALVLGFAVFQRLEDEHIHYF